MPNAGIECLPMWFGHSDSHSEKWVGKGQRTGKDTGAISVIEDLHYKRTRHYCKWNRKWLTPLTRSQISSDRVTVASSFCRLYARLRRIFVSENDLESKTLWFCAAKLNLYSAASVTENPSSIRQSQVLAGTSGFRSFNEANSSLIHYFQFKK